MAKAFFGGVHPDPMKDATSGKAIEKLAPPEEVVIPMSLHIGAPCTPIVAAGDAVKLGQKIGEAAGFMSAPIHASVSGTVVAVEPRPHFNGSMVMSVVIKNDMLDTPDESIRPVENPESLTAQQMCDVVKNAGIVGLGGATFPTHVKISSGLGKVDTVIVNAAECEPYITSDHRIMLEYPEQVIGGAKLLAQTFGVDKVYIGIEDNKMDAIEVLRTEAAKENAAFVEIRQLHTRYPQGAEKQLCQAITGRQVPPGGLPAAIGCAVFNVDTTSAIWRAVYQGMPLIRRIVTVSGSGVVEPKNLECRVGTPVKNLFDDCGGVKEETFKIIMGGPMMGVAQYDMNVPVGKGTNAMLAFAGKEYRGVENPVCIRCGKCVSVCPMHLQPLMLNLFCAADRLDEAEELNLFDCIECGSCSYICPGRVHLVHTFRTAKQKINNNRAAAKAAAEKEAAAKAAEAK